MDDRKERPEEDPGPEESPWGNGGPGSGVDLTRDILAEMERVFNAFRDGISHLQNDPLRAFLVEPGDCVLHILPELEKQSSLNESFLICNNQNEIFKTGPNVRLSDNHLRYQAEIFGYPIIYKSMVSIFSPIILSRDKMTASYLNLPLMVQSRQVSESLIQGALSRSGIVHGIDHEAIDKICSGGNGRRMVVVARGTEPISGTAGQMDLKWAGVIEPGGLVGEDGGIDVKKSKSVIKAGHCIAIYTKATKGTPGTTVTGESVAAISGVDAPPKVGNNIDCPEDENTIQYLAKESGRVRFSKNKLRVHTVYQVRGDVNGKTGNVHFIGDVEVIGRIMSGFTVKAGGSIRVGGSVEAGAKLEAGEDVFVGNGISGHNTSVKAGGDLLARFIANSSVEADGEIIAGSYIQKATVTGGSNIRVHGHGRLRRQTSAAVGGSLMAVEGMRIASAGSVFGAQTHLIAGMDPRDFERMQKIKGGIEFCNANGARILRTLGVSNVSYKSLKQAMENAPPDKQSIYVLLVAKLQELAKLRVKFLKEGDQIREHQSEILQGAIIQIDGSVFPGVQVQIGALASPVITELEAVKFHLDVKERKIIPKAMLKEMV